MNEKVNKFLLAGNKFMPEIDLKNSGFTCSACRIFTENKEHKNLKKQEIQDIFIKMTKPASSMIWLMKILKIYQEEQLLIKI